MPLFRTFSISLLCSLFTTLSSAQDYSDCATSFSLCDQTFLHFEGAKGKGKVVDADFIPCFLNGSSYGQAETNSTWLYFNIQSGGQLFFTLTPDTTYDDLDFIVFQLPADGNCNQKKIVRCMAAGDSRKAKKSPCMGETGLRPKEKDEDEDSGCSDSGDNNWLKPLDAKVGDKYVLLVSNVTAPNGFTIRLQGTAALAPCEVEKKE